MADKYLVGWAYWQFKYYEDLTTTAGAGKGNEGFYETDGTLQEWKVKALSRSYLQFTQGIPTLMKFETENATLRAIFQLDSAIKAPTVIYQNEDYWCKSTGCSCKYYLKDDGQALSKGTYIETVSGPFIEFYIFEPSLDGQLI